MNWNPFKQGHADPAPNPLEAIDVTTALDAQDGSAILRGGLARVLKEGGAGPSDVEQVREAAEAVYTLARLHPSLANSGRDDYGAAGEHDHKIHTMFQPG